VLYGVHRLPKRSVAVLDEPGQNLGVTERMLLQDHLQRLTSDNQLQLIVVTHHAEMVNPDSTILRVAKSVVPLPESPEARLRREQVPLLFARGVIVVEGSSDLVLFSVWLLIVPLNIQPLTLLLCRNWCINGQLN